METVAGTLSTGDGGPATGALVGNIQGVAADQSGNLYISDTDHNRVRKIDASGVITLFAGTGTAGFGGDGGPAAKALLNLPYGLAADSAGNIYVADLGNNRVRRIAADGTILTIAGSGKSGSMGDGGTATEAQLHSPRNITLDTAGNLYISEFEGHRVRQVTPTGQISTVAGTGTAGLSGDGGPATAAQLGYPAGLALDNHGTLFVADSQNQRIRRFVPGGRISTLLGGTAWTPPTPSLLQTTATWCAPIRLPAPGRILPARANRVSPEMEARRRPPNSRQRTILL
jgi:sugar lactone lactonase YvrE